MENNFYKSVVDESPVGYAYHRIICDVNDVPCDYEFIEVNKAFENFTGLIGSVIVGKKITQILPGIEKTEFKWIEYYGEVSLKGIEKEFEQFSEQLYKWYRVKVYSPEKYYFITQFVDISKEKKQLIELENFFELNLNLLSISNFEGNFLKLNKSWEDLMGYTKEELLTIKYIDFIHPDDRESTLNAVEKLKSKEAVMNFINRYRRSDGSYRFIEWYSRTCGNLVYSSARDITDNIQMEKELRDKKEQFELAIKGSNDGIWDWNIITNEVYYSPKWKEQIGYENNDLDNINEFFEESLHPEDKERINTTLNQYLNNELKLYDVEYRLKHKDGKYRWIRARGEVLRDEYGKPYRMAGSHTDITRNKMEEANLFNAKKQAESANIMKSRFLANMSHEIRTPINGILGFLDLLQQTKLTPKQYKYAKEAKSASDILLYLINDILDFSKIEAGKVSIENIKFNIREIFEGVADALKRKVDDKKIDIYININSNLPDEVIGDPLRLRQILNNLVNNAIKFTEKGNIEISINKISEIKNVVCIGIKIKDTGIGIGDNEIKNLFKPFVQADSSTTRKYGGTGLGLAITKELISLMNGEISVESELGKGSIFSIKLNFNVANKDINNYNIENFKNKNIFIIDDSKKYIEKIKNILNETKCNIFESNETEKAIGQIILNESTENKFHIIIVNNESETIDAGKVVVALKKITSLSDFRIFIILSSDNSLNLNEENNNILYLNNPIEKNSLLMAVSNALVSIETNKDVKTKNYNINHKTKILLVEDNAINRSVVEEMFKMNNILYDMANDGTEALKAVYKKDYDIIFMDCQMPVMDGYECTEKIRKFEGGRKHTKIIAMTAHAMEGDKEKCINAGMDHYLSKPLNYKDVFTSIEKFSEKEKDITNIIERSKLKFIEETGIREESVDKIYENYLDYIYSILDGISNAVDLKEFKKIENLAHQLKGSSSNLKIDEIYKLMEKTEEAAKKCDVFLCSKICNQVKSLI